MKNGIKETEIYLTKKHTITIIAVTAFKGIKSPELWVFLRSNHEKIILISEF